MVQALFLLKQLIRHEDPVISSYVITDYKDDNEEKEVINLQEMRQIPQIILFNPNLEGNYHEQGNLDPRAGRFSVSKTSVSNYNYLNPERNELEIKPCVSAKDTYSDFSVLNAKDVDYGISKWGIGCIHQSTDSLSIMGT